MALESVPQRQQHPWLRLWPIATLFQADRDLYASQPPRFLQLLLDRLAQRQVGDSGMRSPIVGQQQKLPSFKCLLVHTRLKRN